MERIIKLTILVFLVLGICLGSDNGGDLEYLGSKKLLSKNPFKNDTVLKKFEEEIKRIKQEGSYQELLEKVKEMEQYIKTKYPEIQCRKSEYKWKKGGIGEIIIDGEEATDSNTSAKSLRWSGDKVIAGSGRMERAVSIARDSNGRLYAAFEEFHTTYNHYIIRIRVSSDNGDTWSNWYYIYSEDYDLLYPDIEVGEGWCDRLILSFYASDIKLLNLWTFDLDNPSNNCSWCIEARDPLGAGENIRPRIAMDYCDQWYVYIVWIEEDVSSGDDVYYSRLMFPCDCNATPSDPICIGEGVVNNVDISWGNYRLWVVYQVGWPGPVYLVKFNTMFGSPTGGYTSELLFSAYCLWPRIALSNHDNKACVLYTRAVDGDENNTNLGFARTEDSGENWEFRWFNDPNTNARLGDIYYMPYSSDGNNFHVAYWEDGYIKYMNTDDLYYWYNCSTVSDNSSNSDEDYVSVLANRENEGMVAWVYRYSSTDYDIHFDNNFAYPDLKVVDIWTNPSSPKEGESCYLYAKVKNIGDEVSPETKVKWYFEGEEISYDWVSSLNPGEEETYFDSYTFQVCGNGAFEACIESVGGEVNTDNNCRSEDLTVICTHPDLAVVDISVSPPSPKEGESCTICAKVRNVGDKSSSSTKVKWYVNGANIGEEDVSSLDPGQERTVSKTYTFSSCGNFTIKVCVESVSDEVNTDNNCRSEDLTVICTHPDLAVVDISVSPPSPKEGESCTICAKVKNIGDKISPSTKVKWYVNGASIGERDVPSLDPGQEETVCKTYTFSSCGNFTIKVCVESVSDEVNTDNNCRSEDLTVICTHPDLAVEKPPEMSPEHPDVGERFTVYAVIKNIGDKESTPTTVKWFLDEDMIATVELGVLSPEESKEVGADAVLNESRKGKLKVIVDPVDGEINTDNNSKDTLIEVSIDEEDIVAPDETTLYSNYPNPFNTSTLIKYYLKKAEKITLTIYDIKGNKVYEYKPGRQDKGFHAFVWDGRSSKGESVVSGIYFYVFRYGNNWKMKRMLYIK